MLWIGIIPVFSEFRCNFWRDAKEAFDASPPDFGTATRSSKVMSDIFEQIMTIEGESIAASDPTTLIMMADARSSSSNLVTAIRNGQLEDGDCASDGFCAGTTDDFGARLEQRLDGLTSASSPRDMLREIRQERICHLTEFVSPGAGDDRFAERSPPERFPNLPSLP